MLHASGLAIGYPGHAVGSGFELELRPGQVLALLGPNGCGKTTLLKTLLGLLPALAGQIDLDGRPLATFSSTQRARRLAYVPQQSAGTFAFTVADLVLMGRTAHGGLLARPTAQDRAAATAAIERMGIAHLAGRAATMVSGGERQLALIARALAQQAQIVVLDEPTANLDFGNQGKVLREVRRLVDDGLGVLFSTHDPNHASRYADEVLLIRDGRPMARGPARQIITHAQLERLYGTPVEAIVATGGARAWLPA